MWHPVSVLILGLIPDAWCAADDKQQHVAGGSNPQEGNSARSEDSSDTEDSGRSDPPRKRAKLTPGDLVPDSEQLRLDIGICVKGPEGSEVIEVSQPHRRGPEGLQACHAWLWICLPDC